MTAVSAGRADAAPATEVPASTGPAGIVFRDWGWRYAARDEWAIRGVDLAVRPGERVAVVGPSGAGKSTLLRAVAAVLPDEPDPEDDTAAAVQGTVLVDDAAPGTVRGRVGLVMQDPEAHTVMSRVGDDVAFGCENTGVPRDETWRRVRSALDLVGLDLPLDRSTTALSGGQRQRLALAGVLAMRPGALVLDEPCANLDPDGVRQLHDAVRAVLDETGATLLVVEHRIGTWLDLVDRLVLLAPAGGVVADGTPTEVLAAHGPALAAAGVWVPGSEPARGSARQAVPGEDRAHARALLDARGLATARGRGHRVGSGIDLTVRRGRVLAVTGPNGVGKSTLGLTLAGLLAPDAGVLEATSALRHGLAGAAPSSWSSRELAGRIGTVFQDPEHQFVAATVRQELAAGPRALGRADVEDRVDRVLDDLCLAHLADANPFTLSGGEQRRLAIGTVLAAEPDVLVLDEPTSGQDRATWQAVVDRLGALADAGTAVVAVTHDRDLVRALDADEVVLGPEGVRPAGPGGLRPTGPGTADGVVADVTGDARPVVPGTAADARGRSVPPVRPRGIRGVQPVASLLGVLALGLLLVLSLDVVSAAVALLLEVLLLPLLRIPWRTLLLRTAPLTAAVPLTAVSIALYGRPSGREWFDLGFVHVTDGSLELALATALRVLAVGLPAIALFVRVDPTDLADGLAQLLRLPARFVLGALAAVRMTTLLGGDWRQLRSARRARGLADTGRLRRGASMAFALLVLALRRATTLAVAMESRGFGAPGRRTWARPARFGGPEWAMVAVLVGIGAVSVAVAVGAGTWRV
ncbi:ATP-binding cassette domain-containing protein [Curtobacterium citreum]|uniref:ATP-binding cassette domain-containing protein n=1 Tax=Curtobacterium citreum TaxID=2036 RepID=UPI0025438154|nr:ATP-binding cassette domain-containing protein [Curtobacterium citreum]WIJ46313.1 ATP-binding cassette domain-containing protein [Curtobacterium citreum]